jgi:hypothetical protein
VFDKEEYKRLVNENAQLRQSGQMIAAMINSQAQQRQRQQDEQARLEREQALTPERLFDGWQPPVQGEGEDQAAYTQKLLQNVVGHAARAIDQRYAPAISELEQLRSQVGTHHQVMQQRAQNESEAQFNALLDQAARGAGFTETHPRNQVAREHLMMHAQNAHAAGTTAQWGAQQWGEFLGGHAAQAKDYWPAPPDPNKVPQLEVVDATPPPIGGRPARTPDQVGGGTRKYDSAEEMHQDFERKFDALLSGKGGG